MKKLLITLPAIVTIWLSMTFFVANIAEQQIKSLLTDNKQTDISIELLSYQRNLFSATVVTMLTIKQDENSSFSLKITSTIHHYPYQATIKNNVVLQDKILAEKAERYFGSPQWIISEEKINLFSTLTGQLTILAGGYTSATASWSTDPVVLDYTLDLQQKSGDFNLNWAGLEGAIATKTISLQSLQLSSHFSQLSTLQDYNYLLKIAKVVFQQNNEQSLLEGISLQGHSQQGKQKQTIDTSNEILIKTYQTNTDLEEVFTDSQIKLLLTGLHQPALQLLNEGASNTQEIESALTKLVNHGAQLTLSQLSSQTPWGEVGGSLYLTLDKGASLTDIIINPYILFDYMSGDASLVLPLSLLEEPDIAESLQMGLMSGLLVRDEQTLNLKSSFQQGELKVNGRVIPL